MEADTNEFGDRVTTKVRWIARIWGALVVAVTFLVFVGYTYNWVTTGQADPHAVEGYPPIENVPPLFTLLSAIGLGIAWRWEGLGGAIAVLFRMAELPVLLIHWPITYDFPRYLVAPYGTWLVIAVPGVLFLTCWWRSRRASPHRGT
jgi:hypothetical protein